MAMFVVALSCGAMAQTKMAADTSMHKMHKPMKMGDCVMMEDGKMMRMMNCKTMPMASTITMKNGTMVMTDGTAKMKDGKSMMLKNGQCVMMSGKVKMMPMKKA